jgi:uncharacterized protein (UPF0332 family)
MSAERDVLIHYRMARARETLAEADLMAQNGHWHGCVNRLYYACFYAVTALLLRHDLSAGKHAGVRSLFNRHFVRTGVMSTFSWIRSLRVRPRFSQIYVASEVIIFTSPLSQSAI